jgi:mannose-6-phosphate isomerase
MSSLPILKLRGDNFTEPRRTPWGGERLASWKRALGLEAHAPLGESWEVSFGPELPSFVDAADPAGARTLAEWVRDDPEGYLGDEAGRGSSALLVKLLDTRAPLSVQIHPASDDPHLADDESGKPECWYVAHAEPGAEILFGLSDAASPEQMAERLAAGDDLTSMLARFPAQAGDFFVVPPGTPHAIGAGVTVVEPQRVSANRRGVTYRYWDHGRRYDAQGRLDPQGELRTLHTAEALRVTDWQHGRASVLRRTAYRAASPPRGPGIEIEVLAGSRGLTSPMDVVLLRGSGTCTLDPAPVGRALTVVSGALRAEGIEARRGESLYLPSARPIVIQGADLLAVIASTPV